MMKYLKLCRRDRSYCTSTCTFLTKLFKAALQGEGNKVKQLITTYRTEHNMPPQEVLLQFKDGHRWTAHHKNAKFLVEAGTDCSMILPGGVTIFHMAEQQISTWLENWLQCWRAMIRLHRTIANARMMKERLRWISQPKRAI